MNAITFDTLKYAETLEAAGIPREQARAQASALSEVMEVNMQELATKSDISMLRKDMTALEERIDSRLIQLEQRMTIKLGTMLTVGIGAMVAITKLL
jgi:hypothetical protein